MVMCLESIEVIFNYSISKDSNAKSEIIEFEQLGGIDVLENLINCESDEVYQKSVKLLENASFFEQEVLTLP